jgi:hypothetical protein
MNKKAQIIENWGLFFMLYGVGVISMLVVLFIWKKMDYDVGFVTTTIMLTIIPAVAAILFAWRLENS